MIYVIVEKSTDGSFGYPTFVHDQDSAEAAVNVFLEGTLSDKYRSRELIVAPLDAFHEFRVYPRFHIEAGKWSPDG